ncbi:MAG: hypothetical protein IPP58_16035 [Holophagaceae bacterium]|uniref:Polysaccharide chain length determinant N-terminal domain-containing protein n=1 Tax=Candidatus Geothrix skivensis TaxID=2954439 RepID=A0A9D7XJ37_9BACT|nr:hypothetical protein [Candidatus Geothrix skivensis]
MVGLTMGVLTALVMICLPNQYKSEARVLAADSRSGTSGAAAMAAAAVGVSIPGQESADAAYVDILNSRSLRESLLKTTFTFKVRTWLLGAAQSRQQTLYEFLDTKNLDRAVKELKTRITIRRDPKSKLLTLIVETESPQLSQQVVQRMVTMLDEFVVDKARTRGGAKAAFAEKRLAEARIELAQAEEAFRVFLDGNRNYLQSTDPSVRLKGQRLDSELKLRTQLLTTLAIGREQALLEEKNDMPILNVLDAGNLPIDKSAPARGTVVLAVLVLATALTWFLQNRSKVLARLVREPSPAV